MEPEEIIKNAISTEKVVRLMEKENKLAFIVDIRANKNQIKKAIERLFNVKVDDVKTMITMRGEKKAIVKLNKEFKAIDIATKLKLI
jgi:large subunit ribosomal protein L23